jgi:hypothetical protein
MLGRFFMDGTWAVPVVALVLICGCGGGRSGVSEVTGTITLDGQPLDGAQVTWPVGGEHDRPSSGVTDASGKYRLMYTGTEAGAAVGNHKVEIITSFASDEVAAPPERVPSKYNANSELTAEVNSGTNQLDFDLTTS